MWTDYVDKIYLINLPFRKERLDRSEKELQRFNIPYEIVPAYYDYFDGRNGLYTTMIKIFRDAIEKGYNHILIFEDDVKILRTDFNDKVEESLLELPSDFDFCYLGGNIPLPYYAKSYSQHLLKVTRCLSTHAVLYSNKAIRKIINLPKDLPIDKLIADSLQEKNTYFAYPLLCSQYEGYSDIYKCPFNNKELIEGRFEKVEEYLMKIENQNTNANISCDYDV